MTRSRMVVSVLDDSTLKVFIVGNINQTIDHEDFVGIGAFAKWDLRMSRLFGVQGFDNFLAKSIRSKTGDN